MQGSLNITKKKKKTFLFTPWNFIETAPFYKLGTLKNICFVQ